MKMLGAWRSKSIIKMEEAATTNGKLHEASLHNFINHIFANLVKRPQWDTNISALQNLRMKRVSKKGEHVISLYHDWETFLDAATPPAERIATGRKLRSICQRKQHARWHAPSHRPDPVDLLLSQHHNRVERLLPYRYKRMSTSALAFLRGSALLMASDLAGLPSPGINVQLCGDCHLSNFGVFATPERNIIFDLNDFDETHPGPFEWDLKRLAISFAVAATENGFSTETAERCVHALASNYKMHMQRFSHMRSMEVWYEKIMWEDAVQKLIRPARKVAAQSILKTWKRRTNEGALQKLTEVVNGQRRIKDNPPFITHPEELTQRTMHEVLLKYLKSLPNYRRLLLLKYRFVDVALKVVGIGSVGTRCGIALLQGEGEGDDPLFLQIKQANESVLERYGGKSEFEHHGERVVAGQRLLQSASDLFLGWTTGPKGVHFYVRQLMDNKGSVGVEELDAVTLTQYAELCARALAHAHARSSDPAIIYGYIGNSDIFEESLGRFSLSYAEQNRKDYEALLKAIRNGRIPVQESDEKITAKS